jgi:hypothetical protein
LKIIIFFIAKRSCYASLQHQLQREGFLICMWYQHLKHYKMLFIRFWLVRNLHEYVQIYVLEVLAFKQNLKGLYTLHTHFELFYLKFHKEDHELSKHQYFRVLCSIFFLLIVGHTWIPNRRKQEFLEIQISWLLKLIRIRVLNMYNII